MAVLNQGIQDHGPTLHPWAVCPSVEKNSHLTPLCLWMQLERGLSPMTLACETPGEACQHGWMWSQWSIQHLNHVSPSLQPLAQMA
jgi:hypothetical protein